MKSKVVIILIFSIILTSCENQTKILPLNSPSQFESWVGIYDFFEFSYSPVGSDISMKYEITIYEENGNYYADMVIDGRMTMIQWKSVIQGDNQSISLILDSYSPESMLGLYEIGDVLVILKKKENEILTYWVELEPTLVENQESGKVYFIKQ